MVLQDKLTNVTLAFAGILQATNMVNELAHTGKTDEQAFQASIQSIFHTDVNNTADVFDGYEGVAFGLKKIITFFTNFNPSYNLMTRYFTSLVAVDNKLKRSPDLLKNLARRIEHAKTQVTYFSLAHETVVASLADIYSDILSKLKVRVMIVGNQKMLEAPENLNKIRAILLAGLRATVLWRQVGGSRLQLLLSQKKIKNTAIHILHELEQKKTSGVHYE